MKMNKILKDKVKKFKNNLENDIDFEFEFDIVDEFTPYHHIVLRYNDVVVIEDVIDYERGSDHYNEVVEMVTEFIKADNGKE